MFKKGIKITILYNSHRALKMLLMGIDLCIHLAVVKECTHVALELSAVVKECTHMAPELCQQWSKSVPSWL